MDFGITAAIQYKLLTVIINELGKEFTKQTALPLIIKNINNISVIIDCIKKDKTNINNKIKDEIDNDMLLFNLLSISTFLEEINHSFYKSKTIQTYICKLYQIIDDIYTDLKIAQEDKEYLDTTWNIYHLYWSFESRVNITNIKNNILKLDDIYKKLLLHIQCLKSNDV